LDRELYLITQADSDDSAKPAQEEATAKPDAEALAGHYQLTHDYLVPSLRDWLDGEQGLSRRGRAQRRLRERTAAWQGQRQSRHLPAWWEWLNIRLCTRKRLWTPPQRQMMRAARRYHLFRGLGLGLLLAVLTLTGLHFRALEEDRQATHAAGLVHQLLDAEIGLVPRIIEEMKDYRRWMDPLLREARADKDARTQLHAILGLLPVDKGQVDYLYGRLLEAQPQEVAVLRDALRPYKKQLLGRLWAIVEQPPQGHEGQRLHTACALADYDRDSARWDQASGPVVAQLVAVNPTVLGPWIEGFRPVREKLLRPLEKVFRDRKEERAAEGGLATSILADYAADQPELLAALIQDADAQQFAVLFPKLKVYRERLLPALDATLAVSLEVQKKETDKERLAHRQANAAVVLLRLGQVDKVWSLLNHPAHPQAQAYRFSDPRVRSYLIHRFGPQGADAAALVKRLQEEPDLSIRRALIPSLGPEEFGNDVWTATAKRQLVEQLKQTYQTAADPGLHAAAEWLLRQWQEDEWLRQTNEAWAKDNKQRERASRAASAPGAKPQWYVNGQGQTMVIIPGPVEFVMGSLTTEDGGNVNEQQHRVRIGRTFAIAAKPVTLAEYQHYYRERFRVAYPSANDKYWPVMPKVAPTVNCPVIGINWYMAAEYCNWLSSKENLDKCYEEDSNGHVIGLKQNYLGLTGYRLPQEAEWEYACRAAALTSRYYGESEELLGKNAWFLLNAKDRTWPVGSKKPNDLGLFDMQGNVWCWCQELYKPYAQGEEDKARDDTEDILSINKQDRRVLRGGSFGDHARDVRYANRNDEAAALRSPIAGFRPARTYR
jgi:formylglycine-generating enzyme required for sulfatase activity